MCVYRVSRFALITVVCNVGLCVLPSLDVCVRLRGDGGACISKVVMIPT
jgi:hypothetical protein